MGDGSKGAWLGAAAIVTIAVLWAAAAGTQDDITCVHFESVPAGEIAEYGVLFGVPFGIFVGAIVGETAARLCEHRRVRLLIVAAVLACVLTALARIAMRCSTDPSTSTLWLRAFFPLAIGVSVLERWTRPPEPVPRATAL